jgi:mRNA-degrading endonuclease toxin of MazEF toxin-antitoxin module
VLPITSLKEGDKVYTFQVESNINKKKGVILVDQIQTIDRDKFLNKIGEVKEDLLDQVERKIHFILALKS